MIPLKNNPNVDESDLANYPDGRVKDNTGSGNGTPVNRNVYGDLHSNISKLMRLYDIAPTELPDNETNGYQIIEALKALASKNDYIYPLNTNATDTLSIDIKLHLMEDNEFLVCLASAAKTTETLIKGSGPTTFTVTYSGDFKANEYVRVIKTSSGVSIIRLADWISLESMVSDLSFLKKANQAQEDAGTIDTVATTPKVNKITFAKRVIGDQSGDYLASASRNGLMSIAQYNQLLSLTNNVKNVGWFAGVDIGTNGSGTSLAKGGDVTSALYYKQSDSDCIITVNLANEMDNTNYFVRMHIESQSSDTNSDNDIGSPVFKPSGTSYFELSISQYRSQVQSLKIHIEVVQL